MESRFYVPYDIPYGIFISLVQTIFGSISFLPSNNLRPIIIRAMKTKIKI